MKLQPSPPALPLYLAFENCQRRICVAHLYPHVGCFCELNIFVSEAEGEIGRFSSRIIQICRALQDLYQGNLLAIIAQGQFRKLDQGLGRKTQCAAIFEFNFNPAVGLGLELSSLRNRDIQKGALETAAGIAINPGCAVHLAQAHDANLRVCGGESRSQKQSQSRHAEVSIPNLDFHNAPYTTP